MVEQSLKGQLLITTKPGDETWSMQQASWACRPPLYGILSRFTVKPAIPFIGLDSQALITVITSEVRSVFCEDSSILDITTISTRPAGQCFAKWKEVNFMVIMRKE